jgi:hypothetical protein
MFQPFLSDPVRPIVTMPPSTVSSPPNTCRKWTAWPRLKGSLESRTTSRPAVEASLNSARFLCSHRRAAADAVLPRTPFARYLPRLDSVAGVPNWFHVTAALSRLTAARCAPVGATAPDRAS